jgi:hypothetical protein
MSNSGAHLQRRPIDVIGSQPRHDVLVAASLGIGENSIFLVLEKLNSQY